MGWSAPASLAYRDVERCAPASLAYRGFERSAPASLPYRGFEFLGCGASYFFNGLATQLVDRLKKAVVSDFRGVEFTARELIRPNKSSKIVIYNLKDRYFLHYNRV
jgi:hypothetical protein